MITNVLVAMCLAVPALAGTAHHPPLDQLPGKKAAVKTTALTFPDGKVITVDVMDTPAGREKGLMMRKSLPKDYGMLFVFPAQMGLQFWMKNTLVPLDIVFIGSDKKITVVHEKVKASKVTTPEDEVARAGGIAQFVLELPAGRAKAHKLKKGDLLKFDAAIPEK